MARRRKVAPRVKSGAISKAHQETLSTVADTPIAKVPLASELPQVPPDDHCLSSEQVDRLWQRLLYEGTQHTNRVNFYLVAQSMFFAAFAGNQRQTFYFSLVCVTAGVLMSLVWMQMARDQDVVVQRTRSLLRLHCPEYRLLADVAGKRRITQVRLSVHLPSIMIMLWLLAGLGDFLTQVMRIGR